jgi:N-acetylmuramoyl-L-alanine amidase
VSQVHPVLPGECLVSIADRYGFGDLRAIHAHPENAELRRKRPDPHALLPGDSVVIPAKEMKAETCASGRRHLLRVRRPRAWLRLLLRDADGTPMAGKKFWLAIGPSGFGGRTNERGLVELEIPPQAKLGELVVWMDDEDLQAEVLIVPLRFGTLPPIDSGAGIQARLTSLGYSCAGDPPGESGPAARTALRAFQRDHGLGDSGSVDEPTLEKLRAVYEGA